MKTANGSKYTTIALTDEEFDFLEEKYGARPKFKARQMSNGGILLYPDAQDGNAIFKYKSHETPWAISLQSWNRAGAIFERIWGTGHVKSFKVTDAGVQIEPDVSVPMKKRFGANPDKSQRPPRTQARNRVDQGKSFGRAPLNNLQDVANMAQSINDYVEKAKGQMKLGINTEGKLIIMIGGS